MRRNVFLVTLVAFFLTQACSTEKKENDPTNQLKEADFINIYLELRTMEIHLRKVTPDIEQYKKLLTKASDSIFKKYQTTDSIYYLSYREYMNEPKKLFSIYERTLDTLNTKINKPQE